VDSKVKIKIGETVYEVAEWILFRGVLFETIYWPSRFPTDTTIYTPGTILVSSLPPVQEYRNFKTRREKQRV
jgi:hypothetical protein